MKCYLSGSEVYTPFRLTRLFEQLKTLNPRIQQLRAYYGYFIQAVEPLTLLGAEGIKILLHESEIEYLSTTVAPYPAAYKETRATCFWVLPREGLISPWSSRATEILQECGFPIVRVERGIFYEIKGVENLDPHDKFYKELFDPLTEQIVLPEKVFSTLFHGGDFRTYQIIDIEKGKTKLQDINRLMGLSLSEAELDFLFKGFKNLKRNPTDVELMTFAQVNSEHCRHKTFNAHWIIDGKKKSRSLFEMIKNSYFKHPKRALVAYHDNAAILQGKTQAHFFSAPLNPRLYTFETQTLHTVFKVETHNHPTAITPFAGAATGAGGEIRDEAATGRGAQSKAGVVGFTVSHLQLPNFEQPWEIWESKKPNFVVSPLEIMLRAPVGAAAFNNEFGRATIGGYFRSFEMRTPSTYGDIYFGYHKPIMLAGGIGLINEEQVSKQALAVGNLLIVLGGPAMRIGIGGGSASSRLVNTEQETDFASVQRANPEMQKRAQEVINACFAFGASNPIVTIHDVGAGGLSNAFPELLNADDKGGILDLRAIPSAELGMTPLSIWCNEAQERFVFAIKKESLSLVESIAARERCPIAVVGEVTEAPHYTLNDPFFKNKPLDLPAELLFGNTKVCVREDKTAAPPIQRSDLTDISLTEAIKRVLQYPCVSDKSFLITISDRSVGGLVTRDPMVGPWQIPVADVGVICRDFKGYSGEAVAIGERPPVAILHPAAAARLAVGEAITNLAAAYVATIHDIVLSANWMLSVDHPGEGAALYEAVQSICLELCPALGISVPVGKDSLSMQVNWEDEGKKHAVRSPLSLIITATAPVLDVRHTLTPLLQREEETILLLFDLGEGANALGGSVLLQTYQLLGQQPPDVDDPLLLRNFFQCIQHLNREHLLQAYHDRSDGGLIVTLCEMAFASHVGLEIEIGGLGPEPLASLFSEELGAVVQIRKTDFSRVQNILMQYHLQTITHCLGTLNKEDKINIYFNKKCLYQNTRITLQKYWSETSYRLQSLRDHPLCAKAQFDAITEKGIGLQATTRQTATLIEPAFMVNCNPKPKVAILREQGVNGHVELAAAFYLAGFECVDIHMSDFAAGNLSLDNFQGLAVGGGFSYGDVLGAGRGFAQSILMKPMLREIFYRFFNRPTTFTLGLCNGCQMLAVLKSLIPGAESWPLFQRNSSEQFEARLSLVKILPSPSIFFNSLKEEVLPIVVSHGEGKIEFKEPHALSQIQQNQLGVLCYVEDTRQPTERYPANPNGSAHGLTGFTTPDGRATILMPHPERVFRTVQLSWHPKTWGEFTPWMEMFHNARWWTTQI